MKKTSTPPESANCPSSWRHLSKKCINRITHGIQKYIPVKRHALVTQLNSVKFSVQNDGEYALINSTLPAYVETLFFGNQDIESIKTLTSFAECIEALIQIVQKNSRNGGLQITIGMGATTDLPSIRISAYLLPAIYMIDKCLTNGLKPPTVLVFKANHAGIYANGFEETKTLLVSTLTFEFLKKFLKKFFPSYAKYFVFAQDRELHSTKNLAGIEKLSAFLKANNHHEAITAVKEMGAKYGGEQGKSRSLFYAAAHPLYNGSLKDQVGNFGDFLTANHRPSLIIDVGGRAQDRFNELSRILAKSSSELDLDNTPTFYVVTKTARVPVYYLARKGDFHIGQDISEYDLNVVDELAQRDLHRIFTMIPEFEYLQFIQQFQDHL